MKIDANPTRSGISATSNIGRLNEMPQRAMRGSGGRSRRRRPSCRRRDHSANKETPSPHPGPIFAGSSFSVNKGLCRWPPNRERSRFADLGRRRARLHDRRSGSTSENAAAGSPDHRPFECSHEPGRQRRASRVARGKPRIPRRLLLRPWPHEARRVLWRHFDHAGRRRLTTPLPRKGAPAPTDADDRFDDSRTLRRTLASNGKQASVIWAAIGGGRLAWRTCAFCECARQHVGAGWTVAALASAQ